MPSETTLALIKELATRGTRALKFSVNFMQKENIEYPRLRQALNYYLLNWRDYTHAGLFSLACEAVDGNPNKSVATQGGIALLSAAFDIHDDIIDNSKTKNGKATVYGKFGLDLSLLLGDAFLIDGYTIIIDSLTQRFPGNSQIVFTKLRNYLFEMGNAHATEIAFRGQQQITREDCMALIKRKAASIEADAYIGALVGRGNKKQVNSLANYGRNLGILTTLREEFIDIFEKQELIEKIRIKRLPIPVLYAFLDTERKLKLEEIFAKKTLSKRDINLVINLTMESIDVIKLKKDMEDLVEESIVLLQDVGCNKAVRSMQDLVSSMLEDL
jgi:geranylgeranyl pyrophosphate synthase